MLSKYMITHQFYYKCIVFASVVNAVVSPAINADTDLYTYDKAEKLYRDKLLNLESLPWDISEWGDDAHNQVVSFFKNTNAPLERSEYSDMLYKHLRLYQQYFVKYEFLENDFDLRGTPSFEDFFYLTVARTVDYDIRPQDQKLSNIGIRLRQDYLKKLDEVISSGDHVPDSFKGSIGLCVEKTLQWLSANWVFEQMQSEQVQELVPTVIRLHDTILQWHAEGFLQLDGVDEDLSKQILSQVESSSRGFASAIDCIKPEVLSAAYIEWLNQALTEHASVSRILDEKASNSEEFMSAVVVAKEIQRKIDKVLDSVTIEGSENEPVTHLADLPEFFLRELELPKNDSQSRVSFSQIKRAMEKVEKAAESASFSERERSLLAEASKAIDQAVLKRIQGVESP